MSKVKVLHIMSGLGMGGAETGMLELVKFIKQNPEYDSKLQFDFLLTGGKRELLDDQFESLGIKLHYISFSLKHIFRFREQFTGLLKRERYNVLHSHQDFVSGWFFSLAKGYLPPLRISYLHNTIKSISNYLARPHRYFTYYVGRYLMYLFSTHISGASRSVLEEHRYHKFPFKSKNIGPVYFGISPEKFILDKKQERHKLFRELEWSDEEIKVGLFAGRMDVDIQSGNSVNPKNPELAIEIAISLVTKDDNWNFIFVGKKGERGMLFEKRIKSIGLSGRIKFLDIRADLPSIMNASDVLVFPSLAEGLGLVAIEAQASCLPVVMSNTVPSEAILNPDIVMVKRLDDTLQSWVESVRTAAFNKSVDDNNCADKINNSPFSIRRSARNFLKLYTLNMSDRQNEI